MTVLIFGYRTSQWTTILVMKITQMTSFLLWFLFVMSRIVWNFSVAKTTRFLFGNIFCIWPENYQTNFHFKKKKRNWPISSTNTEIFCDACSSGQCSISYGAFFHLNTIIVDWNKITNPGECIPTTETASFDVFLVLTIVLQFTFVTIHSGTCVSTSRVVRDAFETSYRVWSNT